MFRRTIAAPDVPANSSTPSLSLVVADNADNVSLNIASINSNGTFRTSDTSSNNIEVSTTNYTGYTLGIAASVENENALSYTSSDSATTYEIPSIVSSVSADNYADNAYAAANGLNNTWGYKPSTLYDSVNDTNVANTNYLPAPTSTSAQTVIAKTHTATGSGATDGYNIAIGARIDRSTVPGNYTNTFVITAVTNLTPYSITYDQNTTDTVSNMPNPNPQSGNVDATTTSIVLASAPSRAGYIFKGWCTVSVEDDADCTGIEYSAGGTYNIDYVTGNNTFTLYARWEDMLANKKYKITVADPSPFAEIGSMLTLTRQYWKTNSGAAILGFACHTWPSADEIPLDEHKHFANRSYVGPVLVSAIPNSVIFRTDADDEFPDEAAYNPEDDPIEYEGYTYYHSSPGLWMEAQSCENANEYILYSALQDYQFYTFSSPLLGPDATREAAERLLSDASQ